MTKHTVASVEARVSTLETYAADHDHVTDLQARVSTLEATVAQFVAVLAEQHRTIASLQATTPAIKSWKNVEPTAKQQAAQELSALAAWANEHDQSRTYRAHCIDSQPTLRTRKGDGEWLQVRPEVIARMKTAMQASV